jgi:predicted transcriptional regulator
MDSKSGNLPGKIQNPTKRAIVEFLKNNGVSYLGEIIKNLSLSYSSGYKYMEELKEEGFVDTNLSPPKYNITQELT